MYTHTRARSPPPPTPTYPHNPHILTEVNLGGKDSNVFFFRIKKNVV